MPGAELVEPTGDGCAAGDCDALIEDTEDAKQPKKGPQGSKRCRCVMILRLTKERRDGRM
jgi:hypothetical protein